LQNTYYLLRSIVQRDQLEDRFGRGRFIWKRLRGRRLSWGVCSGVVRHALDSRAFGRGKMSEIN